MRLYYDERGLMIDMTSLAKSLGLLERLDGRFYIGSESKGGLTGKIVYGRSL